MKIINRLMLNKEEKELLKKVAHLLWDLGEIDSENDIAANILGFCGDTVTTFEELGDLVISIVDRAEDE